MKAKPSTILHPDTVRVLALQAENRQLKQKIKAQQADMVTVLESIERHRIVSRVPFPPAKRKSRRRGDHVRVICCDNHGSQADRAAVEAFVGDVKMLNPHEIIHLGDGVNCGGFLAQHHVMGYVAETDYSYEQDVEDANQFLDAIQENAPALEAFDYIEGNHERRVETWCVTQSLRHARDAEMLRRSFAPEFQLRLAQRGIAYRRQSEFYDGLRVPGTIRRGKCYFWHSTASGVGAAQKNVAKVAGNIVFGHVHKSQSVTLRPVAQGEIAGWCPGCLCKLQPLWQHTAPNDWTHGYALQLVSPSGNFLHLNIPIIDGVSLLAPLLSRA